ncbi:MAG: hypothetical protein HY720_08445 [Planctomycetes bacterium]|nr:hypothetical protein [Planctomycetota bacterium]
MTDREPGTEARRWGERELAELARRRNEHGEKLASDRTAAVLALLLERRFREAELEASGATPPGLSESARQRIDELASRVSADAEIAYKQLEWQVQDLVAMGDFHKAAQTLSAESGRYLESQAEKMERWRVLIESALPGPDNWLLSGGFDLAGHSGRPAGWTVEPVGSGPTLPEMSLVDTPEGGKALRISGATGVRLFQDLAWPPDHRCALFTIEIRGSADRGTLAIALSGGGVAARLDAEPGTASLLLDARSSSGQALDRLRVSLEAASPADGFLEIDRAVLVPAIFQTPPPPPEGPWDFAAGDPQGWHPVEGASRFQAAGGAIEVRSLPDRPARLQGPPCRLPAHLYPAFRLRAEAEPAAWTLILATASGALETGGIPGGEGEVVFTFGDRAPVGTEVTGLELRLAAGRTARLELLLPEKNAEWDRLEQVLGSLEARAKTDPVGALGEAKAIRFETEAIARRIEEWRARTRSAFLDGVRKEAREVLASRAYESLEGRLQPLRPLAEAGDQDAPSLLALSELAPLLEDFWRGIPRVLSKERGKEVTLNLRSGGSVAGILEGLRKEEIAIRTAQGIEKIGCRDLAGADLLRMALEAGADRRFADLLVLAAFAVTDGDGAAAEDCLARLDKAARTEPERARAQTLRRNHQALLGEPR